MKISIRTLDKLAATSISDAIEKIAAESDTIASGVIGSSFSCSGPGSGWQVNYDVSDYAKRALSDDFGALRYIDSDDGREATLEDGEVVWSEESVVEVELPTVEEALENPDQWAMIKNAAAIYGPYDQDDVDALADKIAAPYRISDGNATEYATDLDEASSIIEDWYDYLVNDGKIDSLPSPDLDTTDLDDLCKSVSKWENAIAEAMGEAAFAGHGNYYVSAADRAGLSLSITIRD